jgi:hypothetical protein
MSISVGAQEFAALPVVPASDWVKAQKLIEEDIFKISFQVRRNGVYVVYTLLPPAPLDSGSLQIALRQAAVH